MARCASVPDRRARYPDPACYGRGGTEPTVTDADLLLGYLDPGGPRRWRRALGRRGQSTRWRVGVADPLGIEVSEAARAVHDIVNANMAAAIRVVTVQRGIDPRGLTLVAFGGAGPMHAVRLAEMFGISSVAVPLAAGVASAVGLVGADLHVELVQTRVVDLADADPAELEAAFAELADQARAELADEPGTAFEITRSADVRYRGQAYHLTLPVPDPPIERRRRRSRSPTSFRARFEDAYGIALDLPTQIHNLRVHVVRVVEKFAPRARSPDRRERVRGPRRRARRGVPLERNGGDRSPRCTTGPGLRPATASKAPR